VIARRCVWPGDNPNWAALRTCDSAVGGAARTVVGLIAQGQAEIREGLAEGETVVARAGAFLPDGDRVRAVTAADSLARQ
jgi:hypothetical protein